MNPEGDRAPKTAGGNGGAGTPGHFPESSRPRVLFICTANAARSQMAEALLRQRYGDRYEVFSAGTRQSTVSPRAIAVMREIGIDISHHRSKTIADVAGTRIDLAVTLCDRAHTVCPVVPNARRTLHQGFADPHLTQGSEEQILDCYRAVRDQISAWIDQEFGPARS